MAALQAQDHLAAKWAVGVRLPPGAARERDVDLALAEGAIVRTHVFRGTWQLVGPDDLRWMLMLVGARVVARSAGRFRQLGLDVPTFRKSRRVLEKTLVGGRALTRPELEIAFSRAGIDPAGQRLPHLLGRAELEGLICNGPRRGSKMTWALLEEWVRPPVRTLDRPTALAELARRYFASRGPATVDDFVWWSGLAPSEAREGLEAVKTSLVGETFEGRTLWRAPRRTVKAPSSSIGLVPAFDEYLVAYRHRGAILTPEDARRLNAGGGMLAPSVLLDGKVVGLWRRTLRPRDSVCVELDLFRSPPRGTRDAFEQAARRYAAFLGRRLEATRISLKV